MGSGYVGRLKPGLALSLIMTPWIVILALYMLFAGNCDDGFCPGLLLEAAIAILVLSGIVAVVAWFLVRHGRGLARSGIAAWCSAVAVAAAVFAASQLLENDVFPALLGIIVALALVTFAWGASRLPRAGDPFAPRNAF
jgi:hypothetical protein